MAAKKAKGKQVTRYVHQDASDPRTPETGHTPLLPDDDEVVTLDMDNGWSQGLEVGRIEDGRAVLIDMDPAIDPVLMWAGKRNRRDIPVLPLQRNEVVPESRIAQIIERARRSAKTGDVNQGALFADLEKELRESEKEKRVNFYTHEEEWKNKLICGDSLPVMESLIRYEGLAGKVQVVYLDPPYGIKYDSNFQQRVDNPTNDRDRSGDDVLTIKAFRDTWVLGTHSYLSTLEERLYLVRELLAESGSVFIQIGDEQVHRVRQIMDEVFGAANFCAQIPFTKTSGFTPRLLSSVCDYILWYSKDRSVVKYNQLYEERALIENPRERYICVETDSGEIIDLSLAQKEGREPRPEGRILRLQQTSSQGANESSKVPVTYEGREYLPPRGRHWSVDPAALQSLADVDRLYAVGNTLVWKQYRDEFPYRPISNVWTGIRATGFGARKHYVVETLSGIVERCVLMASDPGDLVFDPTCGSGTTAVVAEDLGRRWITCDTSRVAVNVARQRILSQLFDTYELRGRFPSEGFEYVVGERVTLKSLAYRLEPERVELVNRPKTERGSVRVAGPFEVLTLGRYSVEDWTGYQTQPSSGELVLESFVEVIARLYRPDCEVGGGVGLVHAVYESSDERFGISVGPMTGRVTAHQLHQAVEDSQTLGLSSVHLLGWAFEANVGEVLSEIDAGQGGAAQLVMIRPDALAEGLKVTKAEELFAPLALPEVEIHASDTSLVVTLAGVGLFNRRTRRTDYHRAASGYIAAWYLDEDYDGDCFVDCQMFFDFKKAPNLKPAVGGKVDPEEFELVFTSEPFEPGEYRRVAVKVVDVYGNESTVVRSL